MTMLQVSQETARTASSRGLSRPSPFAELTGKLLFQKEVPKVLALVSAQPAEGVTWVARSLCTFIRQDLRLNVTLLEAGECLERMSPNLHQEARSGHSLLESSLFPPYILEDKKTHEGLILIDCPSLAASTMALALAASVDGILLVVEDGRSSLEEIQKTVRLIEGAQGQIKGIILNKRRDALPGWMRKLFS